MAAIATSKEKMLTNSIIKIIRRFIPKTVNIMAGPLRGTRWCSGSGSQQYWLGTYERDKQEKFFATVSEGDVVFDIGANTGLYTLLAAKASGEAGHVYAFEPAERNLDFLKRHIHLNNCTNVTIFPSAVADKAGTAFFDQGENHATGHLANEGETPVEVVTVDTLISDGKTRHPDLLKIDVEGAEVKVLQGAINALRETRPVVFLAIHGAQQYTECCDILTNAGYHVETSDEQHDIQFGKLHFDYLAEVLAVPNPEKD